MTPRIFPIPVATGRLAILARPRPGDWLADDVAAWRNVGVQIVVSLLGVEEAASLDLADEPLAARAAGLQFQNFPIPDHSVPQNPDAFLTLTADLVRQLEAERSIGIHCRAGIGRSVLLAASILMKLGEPLADALRAISLARGVPVPDTPEQARWLASLGKR